MQRRSCTFMLLLIAMLMLPATFIPNNGVLLAVPTNATIVNLASQKSASQSSIDSGNSADRAVDGDSGSFAQTLSEVHPWWQVDLGEISYIDNIQITTRADCCANDIRFIYVFTSEVPFVSNDMDTVFNQPEVTTAPLAALIGGGLSTTVDVQRSARYIRIQVQTPSATNLYLAEVHVMGIQVPSNPGVTGQWSAVPPLHNSVDTASIGHTWNTLSLVHLSLLPSKKLLFWGRDKLQTSTGDQGWYDDSQGGSDAYVWDMTKQDDPSTPQDERLTLVRNNTTNLFCAGHSFLPNGNLFVAGGDSIPIDNTGTPRYDLDGHGVVQTNIFDWKQEIWIAGPNMRQPRWYPSVVTLNSGETLIISGSFVTFSQASNNFNAVIPNQDKDTEIFGRDGTLQRKTDLPVDLPNYPFAHVGPDGTPFVVSGTSGSGLFYNPSTGSWVAQSNLNLGALSHDSGTSVMYDRGKIMVIGGRQGNSVTRNTDTIDLNAVNPQWSPGIPMHFARYYATSVLMPDGEIFIVGGSKCFGANNLQTADGSCRSGAVMYPEIYDPVSQSWSVLSRQQTVRMYHSVALLLPDARILVAGGGRPGALGESTELKYFAHHEVEIFAPPYLFNADGTPATRPVITGIPPNNITYGQSFNLGVGNFTAAQIQQVVLVRLPSVTHALNFDQQRIVLGYQVVDQQTLSVTAPANPTYGPPGPYMLFVIGPNGAPSVAKIVLFANTVPVTLTATPQVSSITYGQNVTITAQLSPSVSTPAPTGTISVKEGGVVVQTATVSGAGSISIAASNLTVGNHVLTIAYSGDAEFQQGISAPFSVTVNPAPLTVTANGASRRYGDLNPMFTGSVAGLQNGDNITATYSTPATPASNVGSYAIIPSLSDPGSKLGNYTVTFQNGVMTITAAPLSVSVNNASRLYGDAGPAFTGTISGLLNGDNITAGYQSSATAASVVGTYSITATLSDPGGRLSNYAVSLGSGTLTVQPAPLQVTANNKTRMYGDPNPVLDGTITGIRNGDNIQAQYSTTATVQSLVGIYPITPALFDPGARLGNYTVTIQNGTLTVTRSNIALVLPTFNPAGGVYPLGQAITISEVTSGTAAIHYTTDGSVPTALSPVYTGPIILNAPFTLTAIAMQPEYLDSGLAIAGYSNQIPISKTPNSQEVSGCVTADYIVTVPATNGVSGTLALSVSGLPAGATATFSPASISNSGSSTLTVRTSSTPKGTFPFTITVTNGTFTGTTTAVIKNKTTQACP